MKNKENKEASLKGGIRIKAIDVVIIILIILSLVGVYFRYNILDELTSRKNIKDYYVPFEITNIKETTMSYFDVGDKVVIAEDSTDFGYLTTASEDVNNALLPNVPTVPYISPEGKLFNLAYPEDARKNATGRLICRGSYSDENGFLLNGTRPITPGQTIEVHTEDVTVVIKITDKVTEVTGT